MNNQPPVFIDANVFVYFLDETATQHASTITMLQKLADNQVELYTSHHVIEEVLFIISKLTNMPGALETAVATIAELPGLSLIEPDPDLAFAARYIKLIKQAKLGINDALLIQLMLDVGLQHIFTFDIPLLKRAKPLGILPAK